MPPTQRDTAPPPMPPALGRAPGRMERLTRPGVLFWLALAVFLGLAATATLQLSQVQLRQLHDAAAGLARDDLRLLRAVMQDLVRQRDPARLGALLREWGRVRRDCVEIRVLTANGQVLGEYRREAPALEPLQLEEELQHDEWGRTQLLLVQDLAPAGQAARELRVELAASTGAVIAAFAFLFWARWRTYRDSARQRVHTAELDQTRGDLTQAREGLADLRTRLDAVLEAQPAILVLVDAQGRITEWNRAAEEVTHILREDALGLPFTDLIPNVGRQITQIEAAIAAGPGAPEHRARMTTVAGGTVRYSDLLVRPLPGEGPRGALIRLDDVTRQVRFEQLMMQTEKMISLGGLAAGVAHEINSPLSGVLQNCQNVLRRLSPELAANRQAAQTAGVDLARLQDYLERRKVPELLRMVREAAERAGQIVADMLAFSRSGAAGFEKVAVADLVDTALRLAGSDHDLKRHCDFRHIQVARELAPDLPLLYCDRTRLEQALLNLLRNAAQTMAQAATPAPRRIGLRARALDEGVEIEVEDNGPGMDEAACRRVFEPFFSPAERGRNGGLGLSVAYFIVTEQHRGRLAVRSAPGEGTCFTLYLPLRGGDPADGFSTHS